MCPNDFGSALGKRLSRLVFGLLTLAVVVVVATHLGEVRELLSLLEQVRPLPLLAAAVLQCGTYVCVTLMFHRALVIDGEQLPLRRLFPLALAKQFVSQAVPSIGVSGNLMVIRGLERCGVSRTAAVRTVLVSLFSYYLAFAIALAATIAALWVLRDLTPTILSALTLLLFLVTAASIAIFWLGERALKSFPASIRRWLIERDLETLFSESGDSHWSMGLLSMATLLQLIVVLLDTATLYVMLSAVGVRTDPAVVFAALVSAQAVASIGLVPGGLGTFEGTCVALLHAHGVTIEAALAGTVLLRGFTFWLPMLPGFWVSRGEVAGKRGDDAAYGVSTTTDRARTK